MTFLTKPERIRVVEKTESSQDDQNGTDTTNAKGKSHSLVGFCPNTEKWLPIADSNQRFFSIPGGQATWWHCSKCWGWHILIKSINRV